VDTEFGSDRPFSIGVEEELFLVDPGTGRQANSSAGVLRRLPARGQRGHVEPELHACQVELISGICSTVGEAIDQLRTLRRAVRATGAGLLASGTHPRAAEGDAEITDKERYERIVEALGDAAATPVAGLHVHVGMPDSETAIRAFNGLRRHLPLLQAIAANSPFRHGRDTGLASAREVTIRSWPRSGVPRAMRDFDDFATTAELLARAADVPDYTWFWWKLRPHPRLGTVEVRALDVQIDPEQTAAVSALVHCLARHEADAGAGADLPAELVEEGLFRAARFGVNARLPDRDGHLHPFREVMNETMQTARRYADELGCGNELELLPALVKRGGGAGRQRNFYEVAGMDALLRELTRATAGTETGPTDDTDFAASSRAWARSDP
jgi:carboxylate-amine ligase